jgi:hypothetical protein
MCNTVHAPHPTNHLMTSWFPADMGSMHHWMAWRRSHTCAKFANEQLTYIYEVHRDKWALARTSWCMHNQCMHNQCVWLCTSVSSISHIHTYARTQTHIHTLLVLLWPRSQLGLSTLFCARLLALLMLDLWEHRQHNLDLTQESRLGFVQSCWRCWCLTCENTGSTFYIWRRRCVRVRHKVIADAEGGIVKFSGGTRYHTYVKHSSATTSSLRPSNTPWPRLQILQRHTLSYVRQTQLEQHYQLDELFRDCGSHRS